MVSESPTVLYFAVGHRDRNIFGYTWRIGWQRESFYIMSVYAPLTSFKVSLHGPREGLRPGFKVGIDKQAEPRAVKEGGVYYGSIAERNFWFSGKEVNRNASLVVRFRTMWNMFLKNSPSAPGPMELRTGRQGLIVPAPNFLRTAGVDIYLSNYKPYWPREKRARRDEACIGPVVNSIGQSLTGVSVRDPAVNSNIPPRAVALEAQGNEERARGIGLDIDDDGVLWIVEHWMSVSRLNAGASEQHGARS